MCRFVIVQSRIASLTTKLLRPTDACQTTFRLLELFQPWTQLAQAGYRTLATNNVYQCRAVRPLTRPSLAMRIVYPRPSWHHPPSFVWTSYAQNYASLASGDADQSKEGETETLATSTSEVPLPKVLDVTRDRHLKEGNVYVALSARKGRSLQPVTSVIGGAEDQPAAKTILKSLKSKLGCGGSIVKDSKLGLVLELHGNHLVAVQRILRTLPEMEGKDIMIRKK